jgi:hypothetical protein
MEDVLVNAAMFPQVLVVDTFQQLLETPLEGEVNALCWRRSLKGDFGEVAARLEVGQGITTLDEGQLRALELSPAGREAVEVMLEDAARLEAAGLEPVLDCVNGYVPRTEPGLLRTDVCSFHADSATAEADTFLCTYLGASTEAVRNIDALRHVDRAETRAMLLKAYGGPDDEGFADFLADHFYDLHFHVKPDAPRYSFGVGHLWRVALVHPESRTLPCIHRAPDPVPGQRRLLLIS